MTSHPVVLVHPDAETLAQAVGARLITRLVDLQSVTKPIHLVLTGGGVGIKSLVAVAASPAAKAIDWSSIHMWWGDERFLPKGDPDRNETQARQALLDSLTEALPTANIHPIPALDPSVGVITPHQSAEQYSAELAAHADGAAVPEFDLLLLGMGPDGHIASLFPRNVAVACQQMGAIGIEDSPKPPAQRVSLSLPTIHQAREVWVVAAGAEKASAVAAALSHVPAEEVPAAAAWGSRTTLWLIDVDAASIIAQ